MKRVLGILTGGGLAVALGAWLMARERAAGDARLAALQARWLAERAELESALEHSREQTRAVSPAAGRAAAAPTMVPSRISPEEIVARLRAIKAGPGAVREWRRAVYWLEELALAGPAALPAIGGFLSRYEDVDLDTAQLPGRGSRERVPLEFAVPPSLRFGFFDVLRRIGGTEAEGILAESLARTGRGIEVAYLAGALQEMAPNQHRDQAVAVARALLARPGPASSASPLDRNHRDYLFGVLAFLGDTGFVDDAQSQLVRADSQVDRGALRYLQQVLGAQAVPIVAQAYQNPLLTNSAGREPLARLALNFVGADPQADAFYQQTISDPLLTRSHRKNLIEDLNQDGFADPGNLSERDLPLVESRLRLIERLAPGALDEVNAAAMKEAYKDLLNMRAKITGQGSPNLKVP